MACLTENQLLDHAAGRLDPAQARAANEHLDGCADCRAVLAALVSAASQHGPSSLSGHGLQERTIVTSGALADDLPRGTQVDRYVLLKRVGGGAMGVVYAAYDPRLDRTIAIKLLRADVAATMSEQARARMLREAQAMARLSHPNVVTMHDVGTFEGRLYLAMEYLDEGTLASWLSDRSRPWPSIVQVFVQAGRGLAAAHAHGLVHRDFKPANVMVGRDGRARITDFGLVRPWDTLLRPDELTRPDMDLALPLVSGGQPVDRLTAAGSLIGTPRYMAPEQLEGADVDARADQFSFCVALYEAVYGTFPFHLSGAGGLRRAIEQGRFLRPAAGRRAPQWLRRALVRGLSATPGARFPSMDALVEVLESGRERAWRRSAVAAIAVGLAVVTAGAGAAIGYRARACPGAPEPDAVGWTAGRRDAARRAYERAQEPDAADAFRRAATGLDAYAAAWTAARAGACAASRQELPAPVVAARMICLDRRAREVEAAAHRLESADARGAAEATREVRAIPAPGLCLSAGDPEEERAPSAAAGMLVKARLLLSLGRFEEAEERAGAAAEAARLANDRAAEAEADGLRGEALLRRGRWPEAEEALRRGALRAEVGRRDDLDARLSTSLSAAYLDRSRLEDARLWTERAEAALRRMAVPDEALQKALREQQARLAGAAAKPRADGNQ